MYDFIIVGAGSSGCALANRLSANPDAKVLLLEAGGWDRNPFIHMPAGLPKLVANRDINWDYETEPEPQLNNRRLYWPRGRVLGGSSAINAMCYSRGQAEDYDEWAASGNTGWSFKDVLPYFKKSEDQELGQSEFHGVGGPLKVQNLRYKNALSDAFIEAATSLGYPRNNDFNGKTQEGIGFYQVTQNNGRRCSSASAYLHPVKHRKNLTIKTRALTSKILLKNNRAIAVEYLCRGKM
ncbi:MAG: GMC family oxidoreductase N-terminal domain-containing protein, partial [Gammaproteobacteria bacterium]|nr:GMC family oxidoreductase N-terminal domain-containing protein [Gammaproteobacteria bacterium]